MKSIVIASMFSERARERLGHIVEYSEAINAYMEGLDLAAFRADQLRVDAVERCLSRITEAVIRIGEAEAAIVMPDIPFHLNRGMRNRLRHEYKGIDTRAVFETVHDELPKLHAAAVDALQR